MRSYKLKLVSNPVFGLRIPPSPTLGSISAPTTPTGRASRSPHISAESSPGSSPPKVDLSLMSKGRSSSAHNSEQKNPQEIKFVESHHGERGSGSFILEFERQKSTKSSTSNTLRKFTSRIFSSGKPKLGKVEEDLTSDTLLEDLPQSEKSNIINSLV